jgi:hypothetical protein
MFITSVSVSFLEELVLEIRQINDVEGVVDKFGETADFRFVLVFVFVLLFVVEVSDDGVDIGVTVASGEHCCRTKFSLTCCSIENDKSESSESWPCADSGVERGSLNIINECI